MGLDQFKALMISKDDGEQSVNWETIGEADLMPGDVLVRVSHSTINYKDGLAITGKAPVVRRWPMIAGIDFAGVVESSQDGEFKAGDIVVPVPYLHCGDCATCRAGKPNCCPHIRTMGVHVDGYEYDYVD